MAETLAGIPDAAWLRAAAWGVLALPLLSFLLNGLWLGRKHARAAGRLATALMAATLGLAVLVVAGTAPGLWSGMRPAAPPALWDIAWMDFGGGLSARFGFHADPASLMMVLLVAFISFLVHAYSIRYMRDERGAGRFFALLSLFTFAMLGLVVSGNLIQTFFFWELVGAASYLLIGFWYMRPAAVAASKKAFLLTRFADAFFLMGILVVGVNAGTFDIAGVNDPAAAAALNRAAGAGLFAVNLLTLSTLLLYLGAWGKSAMFPFHVWLPDAMEGPTPVSALIHSATMVVAGIFLTARLFPLFAAAEHTLDVVALTGAFTAVFAAAVACAQTDIKRILAYSTLSQLGLMMLALGVASPAAGGAGMLGYSASLFHVFTHAFFKSLLFLSAGIVIHAIHDNDLRAAGGLRKPLPWTWWTTLIACLALAGLWPFAGFFSKEEILLASLGNGRIAFLLAGLLTGGLTAFYMTRYFLLVFHGPARTTALSGHGRAEPLLMFLPLAVLAIPSVVAGWLARPFFLQRMRPWSPEAASVAEAGAAHPPGFPWLPAVAIALALVGIGAGLLLYGRGTRRPGYPDGGAPWFYRLLRDKFYVDEAYAFLVRRVASRVLISPTAWAERHVINASFDRAGDGLQRMSAVSSRFQNGQVQRYLAVALAGLLLLFLLFGRASAVPAARAGSLDADGSTGAAVSVSFAPSADGRQAPDSRSVPFDGEGEP